MSSGWPARWVYMAGQGDSRQVKHVLVVRNHLLSFTSMNLVVHPALGAGADESWMASKSDLKACQWEK